MILTSLTKFRDAGLLFLRIGLGAVFIVHGAPKLLGGPVFWKGLGKSMAHMGIDVFPMFWGFMASAAECIGGIFITLGLFFRPATILLAITMTVATAKCWHDDPQFKNFAQTSHPLKMAIVFYSLILIGPGRFSIDKN